MKDLAQRISELSPAQKKLLELRLKKQQMLRQDNKAKLLKPVSRHEQMPASFLQEAIWNIEQLDSEKSFFNIPITYSLNGKINITILEKSIN